MYYTVVFKSLLATPGTVKNASSRNAVQRRPACRNSNLQIESDCVGGDVRDFAGRCFSWLWSKEGRRPRGKAPAAPSLSSTYVVSPLLRDPPPTR